MSNKVAIIIVSHSVEIGIGVKRLISQVISDVPVLLACGTDDNDVGTSIEKINQQLANVSKDSGGILFYDLGSAKMNAEMAIELTGMDNIMVADSIPLVEGSYIAAVESNMGGTKEDILHSLQKLKMEGM
ncbi:dihydroxyacetone kinase phosphoryl donor subunit DhaM [Gracilibacillus marinus]|uniref:phosphoenolpyruvate--glycerone phosphotransferase n=1 Tax=Gracilibacillus marinus TaxID=630535 RepID=A0ABV8W0C4_9BACI